MDKSVLFGEREFSEMKSNHQGLFVGFIRLFARTDEPILKEFLISVRRFHMLYLSR